MTKKISGLLKAITFCVVAGLFSVVLLSCSSNVVDEGHEDDIIGNPYLYLIDIVLSPSSSFASVDSTSIEVYIHTAPFYVAPIPELRIDDTVIESMFDTMALYRTSLDRQLTPSDSVEIQLTLNDDFIIKYFAVGFDPVVITGIDQDVIAVDSVTLSLVDLSYIDDITLSTYKLDDGDWISDSPIALLSDTTLIIHRPSDVDSLLCHIYSYKYGHVVSLEQITAGDYTYTISQYWSYTKEFTLIRPLE